MPDREKVIKAIDICLGHGKCHDCHYSMTGKGYTAINCRECMMRDALALLKEQKAVEPRRDANCVRMFRCGAYGEYVGFIDSDPGDPNEQDNYCRNCGRKVKWK